MSKKPTAESQGEIIVFGAKQIRREWVDEQWFFSVVDIIGALTDSPNPRDYWYRMKRREKESSGIELSTFCRQLKLTSADGKSYKTDAFNTEGASGRWAFIEITDPWDAQTTIRTSLARAPDTAKGDPNAHAT